MKLYIETLGCPKNENDSEIAAGILEHAGHEIVDSPEEADGIMVNTCAFIHDAKTESINKIFDLAQYKEDDKLLIVSGCLSQRYNDDLYDEMPEVDIFIGVNDYPNLPTILTAHQKGKREKHRSNYSAEFAESPFRKLSKVSYSSTLKIAEGCNNICTYCVIPQIRGKYRSRREEYILNEAENLAKNGCKELILVAQDVTAYGIDIYHEYALPKLLRKLCKIKGIEWIRLMYCYEDRITDALINVMAEEEKICPYIDIPIQHCSNKILKAMNRRSTKISIVNTIKRLRDAIPDIHIRTTLITGFPGEGEEEFEELADFVEKMRVERLGVFAYSQEEGTPAAEMSDQLEDEIKQQRQEAIMRRQLDISLDSNRDKIGKTLAVLVEEEDLDHSYIGRTKYDAPEIDNSVIFTSEKRLSIGQIVYVKIIDAFDYDLVGKEAPL